MLRVFIPPTSTKNITLITHDGKTNKLTNYNKNSQVKTDSEGYDDDRPNKQLPCRQHISSGFCPYRGLVLFDTI